MIVTASISSEPLAIGTRTLLVDEVAIVQTWWDFAVGDLRGNDLNKIDFEQEPLLEFGWCFERADLQEGSLFVPIIWQSLGLQVVKGLNVCIVHWIVGKSSIF